MANKTSKKDKVRPDEEWVDLFAARNGWRFQIPRVNFVARDGWVECLWTAFLHMAANGTSHYRELKEIDRRQFEEFVNKDMLFDLVETVKRKAVAEAASFGQEVPIPALSDLSAAGVQFGVALPEADRTRLDNILRLLYGLIVRLNGLRGSSTAGRMRLTPRSRFCRNESRDEWVAHRVEERRAASKPPNWDEIFDGILKLAPSNDWSIPGSSKSLSEAHYRYNARQRKRDRKAKD